MVAGAVIGVLWRLAAPIVVARSEPVEVAAAVDATYLLLTAAAGVVTAVMLRRNPGRAPAARLAAVLVGSWAAALVCAGVCLLLGGPLLRTWAATVAWPLTATVIMVGLSTHDLVFRSTEQFESSETRGWLDPNDRN